LQLQIVTDNRNNNQNINSTVNPIGNGKLKHKSINALSVVSANFQLLSQNINLTIQQQHSLSKSTHNPNNNNNNLFSQDLNEAELQDLSRANRNYHLLSLATLLKQFNTN
jgi:hypothetical protein